MKLFSFRLLLGALVCGASISFAEPDTSYVESDRKVIKAHIGDDMIKLIMGSYPAHTAAFYERQRQLAARSITQNPNDLQALNDHAAAQMYLGQLVEAERTLIGIMGRTPEHYDTIANLGVLYKVAGQFDKGVYLTTKALEKRPRGHLAVGDYYLQAMKWTSDAKRDPSLIARKHFLDIPRDQRIRGEEDVDVEQLKHLILAQPRFADGYAVLGDVLTNQGQGALAALAYQRANELQPNPVYQKRLRELFPEPGGLDIAKKMYAAYAEKAEAFRNAYYQAELTMLDKHPGRSVGMDEVLREMQTAAAPSAP